MSAHEILPRLWLGNKTAAADEDFLRTHDIRTVFNCTKHLPFHPSVQKQYRVPVDDTLEPAEIKNMFLWSPEIVYKLLAAYKRGETILVHCVAGMQRSAAVVAMFLMATMGLSAEAAMQYVRDRRAVAFFPAANFQAAIEGFGSLLAKHRAGGAV
jgi:protein-tyrosine phosphatase